MEVSKLKFIINETGELTEEEIKVINDAYRGLFTEIYGYDILGEYLEVQEQLKGQTIYKDTYINAIDIVKSISHIYGMSLLMIFDEDDRLLGAGRIRKIEKVASKTPIVELFNKILEKYLKEKNEKCISIPDIAVSSAYEDKDLIWTEAVKFLENYYASLGYDRMYLEIPRRSQNLNKVESMGYCEDICDIPYNETQKTIVLNKSLERKVNEQLNFSRK